ncbi:hypothetical protein [Ruminococcus flavefaciens]|uniref:hypothetical protein n=1 Tax=Ruminococcus flavefaciens TaxID=1265 RepID=UPI0015678E7E|nr:hypothetical protein [Ruminococcus flavefaciens]
MKKTLKAMAAMAVAAAAMISPMTSNALAWQADSEALKNYVKLDSSHIFCSHTGYLAEGSYFMGAFVTQENNTDDGSLNIMLAYGCDDLLNIKMPDGITTEDVENALAALDEKSDTDFSGYSFIRTMPEGEAYRGFSFGFSAKVIESSAAKELSEYLREQGLITASELYFDKISGSYTVVDYPFYYHASSEAERDKITDEIRTAFPEYKITSDPQNDTVFYLSDPEANDANSKLTAADNILEEFGMYPNSYSPEMSAGMEAGQIDTFDYVNGDANDDNDLTLNDAVAVLQNIALPAKYPLTPQGKFNADCDGKAGISGGDALWIQMKDAGLV